MVIERAGDRPDQWHVKKLIDRAYEKMVKSGIERIDPITFENFDQAVVKKDAEWAEKKAAVFDQRSSEEQREAKRMSDVFEGIIVDHCELSEWLGSGVTTNRTSKFDDFQNGVDLIATFDSEEGNQNLALAVDVTFSDKAHIINEKLRSIKKKIKTENLSEIKYFETPDGTFKGSLYNVPKVLVAADQSTVQRLAQYYIDGNNRALGADPVQLQIIDEIYEQLGVYAKYARSLGNEKLAIIHEKQQTIIERVMSSKEDFYRDKRKQEYRKQDPAFVELMSVLKRFEHLIINE